MLLRRPANFAIETSCVENRRLPEGLPALRGTEARADPEAGQVSAGEEAELPVPEGGGERSRRSAG